MRTRASTFMLAIAMSFAAVGLTSPAAAAANLIIKGSVTCSGGAQIVGVWVHSSGGGSKFAGWTRTSTTTAAYSTSIATSTPTEISLHIGCGGSKANWSSDNWTPLASGISSSSTINATSCGGGLCTWNRAVAAADWAGNQGSSTSTCNNYYGLCLEFVYQAYVQGADIQYPVPSVLGKYVIAKQEWQCYAGMIPGTFARNGVACPSTSQIQTTWRHTNASKQIVTDSNPPRGAWVFYPTLTKSGHIAISLGGGNVEDPSEAKASNGCYVHVSKFNGPAGYVGWAFPYNASH